MHALCTRQLLAVFVRRAVERDRVRNGRFELGSCRSARFSAGDNGDDSGERPHPPNEAVIRATAQRSLSCEPDV